MTTDRRSNDTMEFTRQSRAGSPRLLASVLTMLLIMTSCSLASTDDSFTAVAAAPPALASTNGPLTIGFSVQSDSRPLPAALVTGARDAARMTSGLELVVVSADDDPDQQRDDIESLIRQDVDAIIVSPIDSAKAVELADLAQRAGIPLLVVGNQIGALDDVGAQYVHPGTIGLVANDDLHMGRLAAGFVGGPVGANILVLEGDPQSASSTLRLHGFVDALDALGVDYQIAAQRTGWWSRDEAADICSDRALLAPIDLVFSMSDEMTIGCLTALTTTDLPRIPFISIGGSRDGMNLLAAGSVIGLVCQSPTEMGSVAIATVVRAFETGEPAQGLRISIADAIDRTTTATCAGDW